MSISDEARARLRASVQTQPRQESGKFARRRHSAPDGGFAATKVPERDPRVQAFIDAAPDDRRSEVERGVGILEDGVDPDAHDQDELVAAAQRAAEHATGSARGLVHIERSDELGQEQLEAYLAGDVAKLDDALEESVRESRSDRAGEVASEIAGDLWGELPDEAQDELQWWVEDQDDSDVVGELVRVAPPQLVQYAPGSDDEAFERHLQARIDSAGTGGVAGSDEIQGAILDTLAEAGIDRDDPRNQQAAAEIATGSGIYERGAEGLRLRIVSYAPPGEVALHPQAVPTDHPQWSAAWLRDSARTLRTTDPEVFLADPWNGTGCSARFSGAAVSRLTADANPPLLDATQGHGSIDDLIGANKPAFAATIETIEWSADGEERE